MFTPNKEFLKDKSITSKNVKITSIQVTEDYDFMTNGIFSEKYITIYFEDRIIPTKEGMTREIVIKEKDFYKYFNFTLVTFCFDENYSKEGFEPDNCQRGDLIFTVPLEWLMQTIDSNLEYFPMGFENIEIKNLSDFIQWMSKYTHSEESEIYKLAKMDGKIMGEPLVNCCDYCLSFA